MPIIIFGNCIKFPAPDFTLAHPQLLVVLESEPLNTESVSMSLYIFALKIKHKYFSNSINNHKPENQTAQTK